MSGDEGLGKSKAAAAVIQELQKREAESDIAGARNVMVAYFFCDATPDCSKAENVLKSLMWQLILGRDRSPSTSGRLRLGIEAEGQRPGCRGAVQHVKAVEGSRRHAS